MPNRRKKGDAILLSLRKALFYGLNSQKQASAGVSSAAYRDRWAAVAEMDAGKSDFSLDRRKYSEYPWPLKCKNS
jgi:hypothetical protein